MSYGSQIQVQFVNNDGGGFAENVFVDVGTTLKQLFDRRMRNADPSRYVIRVNGQSKEANYPLQHGDKIHVVPTKVAAA